jgi:DUF1365 family protein
MTAPDRSRTVARIDYDDAQGLLLQTSVSGKLEPLSAQSIRKAMFSYGAMTLGVIARIHWQALKLWFKRVPFFSKPSPPEVGRTYGISGGSSEIPYVRPGHAITLHTHHASHDPLQ